jgi:hypothetical protein
MTEVAHDLSACLLASNQAREVKSGALRGFRYALALSFAVWAGIAVLAMAGCAGTTTQGPLSQTVADRAAGSSHKHCGDIPLPPVRFDHAPTLPTFVSYLPFGQIGVVCRAHGVYGPAAFVASGSSGAAFLSQVTDGGFEIKACSWITGGKFGHVVLPRADSVTSEWSACALRHEYAHINGWPASHPDGHYEDDWL